MESRLSKAVGRFFNRGIAAVDAAASGEVTQIRDDYPVARRCQQRGNIHIVVKVGPAKNDRRTTS